MKKLLFLINLCCMLATQSCTTDQEPVSPEIYDTDPTITHLVIKFENHLYETDAIMVGDSVTYLNKEYSDIYLSKIINNPDIAATISTDENGISYVEYFPSEKNLLDKYNFFQLDEKSENMCNNATRSGVIDLFPKNGGSILAIAELFDDRNFSDTKLIAYATETLATAVPKLSNYGFNDKTSSIKVYNKMNGSTFYRVNYIDSNTNSTWNPKYFLGSELRPVLKCFHNSNFSGGAIYCIAPPTGSTLPHADTNLKGIGWNDKISSIAWLLVYDFSLFEGENPTIPSHPEC